MSDPQKDDKDLSDEELLDRLGDLFDKDEKGS